MNSFILALVIGGGVVLFLSIYAAYFGIRIALRWNPDIATEEQLGLEKRQYLISTIVKYLLGFEMLSLLLFVYTANDIHEVIPGAMCATGSLNANAFGFPALIVKILTFFLYGLWIAINHLDTKAEEPPLIRVKYLTLLASMPFLIAENILMVLYFANIDPETLVSCCGAVFTPGEGVVSTLSPLPVSDTMVMFFTGLLFLIALGIISYKKIGGFTSYAFSLSSTGFFFISISALISFIVSYIYQMPSHPCPFDILWKEYNYIGYPMYTSLFGGTLTGVVVGAIEPFKKRFTPRMDIIDRMQRRAILLSLLNFSIFVAIALWYIIDFKYS